MDEFARTVPVPIGRRIFDRIVTDGDHEIGGVEKAVAGLVS